MRRTLTIATATATVAAVALAAGCGSSSSSSAPAAGTTTEAAATTAPATTAPATTAPATTAAKPAAAATTVNVTLGKPQEFSLGAAPATAAAGKVTFVVKNQGKILHEMVVVPGADPAALKEANGEASEAGSPGEVADVQPGKGGKVTINLPAGDYVLLCNLPGHYAAGMYTTFTVS